MEQIRKIYDSSWTREPSSATALIPLVEPRHTLYAQTKRRLFIDSSLTPMTLNWYTKAQTFVLKVPFLPKFVPTRKCLFGETTIVDRLYFKIE